MYLQQIINKKVKGILLIAFVSLILALLMFNTYFPSLIINLTGLVLTGFFIYHYTLRKGDFFSFIMVMYICCLFPYMSGKGGAFTSIALIAIMIFLLIEKRLPGEINIRNKWPIVFIAIWIVCSVLGWMFNNTARGIEWLFTISSFFGMISVFIVANKIVITRDRLLVFLKINYALIIYSTLLSINSFIGLINVDLPFIPTWGSVTLANEGYYEGGGIIGSSPLYGEHSLLLTMLFVVFYFIGKSLLNTIERQKCLFFVVLAGINVLMSTSRSVFFLLLLGFLLVFAVSLLFSVKNFGKFVIVLFVGCCIYLISNFVGVNGVFQRIDEYEEQGRFTSSLNDSYLDKIKDGRAFNRETAFYEAQKKFKSKDSWLIGYGWGLANNNRDAFYVDGRNNERGSAHSQIIAVLFLFGIIGLVTYYSMLVALSVKSFITIKNRNILFFNKLFASFACVSVILFIINEIKADSISIPGYFTSIMIIWGLAWSNCSMPMKPIIKTIR